MIKSIIHSVLFVLFLIFSFTSIQAKEFSLAYETKAPEAVSCTWPALVLLEADNEENLKHGDEVTIEAFGYSQNGGIPANKTVDDDYRFYWQGEIELINKRLAKVTLDSNLTDNTLYVVYTLTVDGQSCKDTASITFEIANDITSQTEILQPEVLLYPNPGSGILYIEYDEFVAGESKVNVEVISLNSKVMLNREFIYRQSGIRIDLSDIPIGIYNIRITHPDSIAINRLYSKM